MTTDPVCGMEVDPRGAPAKSDFDGRRYYFCSLECMRTFDMNLEFYLDESRDPAPESVRGETAPR